MIQNLDDTDSGGEDESDDQQQQQQQSDEDSSVSDSEDTASSSDNSSCDDETDDDSDDSQAATVSQTQTQGVSRDGTAWNILPKTALSGRLQAQNVFSAKPGPTAYTRTVRQPVDAFRLLLDEGMFRHIKTCTVQYARQSEPSWDMTDTELDAFVGLLYLRGCMNARSFPIDLLWSEKYGCQAFRQTMARDRFKKIKKYVRFDCRTTRQERLKTDKFCMMTWVLQRFVENSQKAYIPDYSLTVDEQLFPMKARCRFTQFMPNKPDKFGIKFWILAEVSSKYCLNITPYLGKDEERVDSLGTHTVMKLMEPYLGRGYNVTTDNFFTSKDLALKLVDKRTSLVGTVRLNRKEIPPCDKLPTHESVFFSTNNNSLNLVKYQAKPKKTVVMMSTLHRGAECQTDGKKKPESVLFYNENKCGVDVLDAMCKLMSTKASCRRWPLAVFFNVLDMAAVNSWIRR